MDQDSSPVVVAQPFDQQAGKSSLPLFVPKVPRCPPRKEGEIVVCAQNPETFRLRPLPDKFADEEMPQARLKLGEGASVSAEVEREGINGHISNRVMIRGRIKF